jgi:hypothetical protein
MGNGILNDESMKTKNKKLYSFSVIVTTIGFISILFALILYTGLALASDRNTKLRIYKEKMREWKKFNSQKSTILPGFDEISVLLKPLPSKTKYPLKFLNTSQSTASFLLSPFTSGSYSSSFHSLEAPEFFTKLKLDEENIPLPSPSPHCLQLAWTETSSNFMYDLYTDISDMPSCSPWFDPSAKSCSSFWKKCPPNSDTPFGVLASEWKQEILQISNPNQCAINGGFFKPPDKCYVYWVLKKICISIAQSPKQEWIYTGGCCPGGSPVLMVKAQSGGIYNYSDVKIEIHSHLNPEKYVALTDSDLDLGFNIDIFYNFAFILVVISVLCCVLICGTVFYAKCILKNIEETPLKGSEIKSETGMKQNKELELKIDHQWEKFQDELGSQVSGKEIEDRKFEEGDSNKEGTQTIKIE